MTFYLVSMLACVTLSAMITFLFVVFSGGLARCKVKVSVKWNSLSVITTSGPSFTELTLELQYLQSKSVSMKTKLKQSAKNAGNPLCKHHSK